jgi:hypothetical protein
MKSAGKTIVLVTHEMTTVEEYCHRAMLIDDGTIRQIGDPGEIGRQYLRINFQPRSDVGREAAPGVSEGARLLDAWIEDAAGERATSVEHGDKIHLRAEIELTRDAAGISVGFIMANADNVGMFHFGTPIEGRNDAGQMAAGERVKVSAELENPLAPGRYYVHCGVQQDAGRGDVSLYEHSALDFVVFGGERSGGVLSLEHQIDATVEDGVAR